MPKTRRNPGRNPVDRPVAGGLHVRLALRLALRQLHRSPGTVVSAALTLAVGFGAATAIYSVMNGFAAPLPVPEGERVVQVRLLDPEEGRTAITPDDLRAWQQQSRSLQALGAYSRFGAALNTRGHRARMTSSARITPEALDLLRVEPRMGRLPNASAADRTAVVLSHGLWQSWLDGAPDVLGRSVRVGDELRTVIGVMPEGFRFPFREDLWVGGDPEDGGWGGLEVVGRLAEGADVDSAQEELQTLLARQRAASGTPDTARVQVRGFTEERGESGEVTMLLGLLLMVLGLVLVSCSNVSNLLLERALARSRVLAVHQALGAVPGQVVLQVLAEALLIAVLGLIPGIAVAWLVVRYVESTLSGHWGYFWMKVELDPSAVLFAVLLGLVTALVSGALPAWRAVRTNIVEPLQQESAGSRGARKPWASWLLLTGQITFSCAAVIASVLMGLGLFEHRRVLEVFPAESVLYSTLSFDGERYEQAEARREYRERFLAELERDGAIREASLSTGMPGLRSPVYRFTVEGRPLLEQTPRVLTTAVTPDYFEVFGLHLLEGRSFRTTENAEPVALVSEDFVRVHLGGGSPIGRTLDLHGLGDPVRTVRIIGVVSNLLIYASDHHRDLNHVYVPLGLDESRELFVSLRLTGDRRAAVAALGTAAQSVDPEVPVSEVSPVSEMLAWVRQFMETLGILALLGGAGAVVVVTIGLYGLVAFEVRRRLPEYAVRLALGASTDQVLWGVVRRGVLLVLPGVLLGFGLTYLVTPLLGIFLGGADSHDPRVFGGALAVYVVIALLAAGLPARRAAYTDPWKVLRDE